MLDRKDNVTVQYLISEDDIIKDIDNGDLLVIVGSVPEYQFEADNKRREELIGLAEIGKKAIDGTYDKTGSNLAQLVHDNEAFKQYLRNNFLLYFVCADFSGIHHCKCCGVELLGASTYNGHVDCIISKALSDDK